MTGNFTVSVPINSILYVAPALDATDDDGAKIIDYFEASHTVTKLIDEGEDG